jgi:hypothetical protein
MRKRLIIIVVVVTMVAKVSSSLYPFDPEKSYKLDDRRPLPEYIYEGKPNLLEDQEPPKQLFDDIWSPKSN